MLEPERRVDVVVVGASVAGLAAAGELVGAGVHTIVLDARDRPGGRLATRETDGFRLDAPGPPLLASYRELRQVPGLGGLVLRPFAPGALVHSEGRLHTMGEPLRTRRTIGAHTAVRALGGLPRVYRPAAFGHPLERARVGAALTRLAASGEDRLLARPERPVGQALAARGLSSGTAGRFLRPLLRALLCDAELSTSSRCADLALAAFARGRLCLPEGGAGVLPGLLARALPPGTVHTGVRVTSLSTTRVATEEHGEFRCSAVLLATGARSAAELLPGLRVPRGHPVTVLHHAAGRPPAGAGRALLLDADGRGPIAHTAVTSEIDPTRAPRDRALISTAVLGTPGTSTGRATALDAAVRTQLGRLYGTSTADWELLDVQHDPAAVDAMPAPHDRSRPVRLLAGLYVCGEHRDTSSVQGALRSGRRAAGALLTDFAAPGAPRPPGGAAEPLSAVA